MCGVLCDAASYIRKSDLGQSIASHQGYPLSHTFALLFFSAFVGLEKK